MYDEEQIAPMREELTSHGIKELRTPKEVDETLASSNGTVLVVVNSVCGCSAGGARPGVITALKHSNKPDAAVTVFAGQDGEATQQARKYFTGFQPSSPSIALLKNGKLVHMVERHNIEGHTAEQIAENLTKAFDQHCN